MGKSIENQPKQEQSSSSTTAPSVQQNPAPAPEMGLRVTQAEFARIMGVSRQTVTKWKKAGKLHPELDGRFCPKRAASSILKTTDPNRVRARVLKDAAQDGARLRAENKRLSRLVDEHKATAAQLRADIARCHRDIDERERTSEIAPDWLAARWSSFKDMTLDERRRQISLLLDEALIKAADELASEAGGGMSRAEVAEIDRLIDESTKAPLRSVEVMSPDGWSDLEQTLARNLAKIDAEEQDDDCNQ